MEISESEEILFWPPDDIKNFREHAKACYLKDGEMLIWAGDNSGSVYFVEEGHIKMCHFTEEGDCIVLLVHGPGEIVGVGGVLSKTPRAINGVAMGPGKVWEVSADDFFEMMRDYPDLAIEVATALASRMRQLDQQVLRISSMSVEQRIALTLIEQLVKGENGDKNSSTHIHLTHQALANMVGVCRQTITVTLNQFCREGILIQKRGDIEVLDLQKLKGKTVLD